VSKILLLATASAVTLLMTSASVLALPLVQSTISVASHREAAPSAPDTSDYLRAAIMGDKFEVNAAQVARSKSQNHDVQRFAQMMVRDYSSADSELSSILKQSAFSFTPPANLDNEHAAMVHELQSSPLVDFDRRYMQLQIAAHESALRLQNDYARAGRDQPLRKFALGTVPKIKMHLELARQIFAKMSRLALRSH
jgi:putative membrane protein